MAEDEPVFVDIYSRATGGCTNSSVIPSGSRKYTVKPPRLMPAVIATGSERNRTPALESL